MPASLPGEADRRFAAGPMHAAERLGTMGKVKMKSNRSAMKRFRKTGSGRIKREHAYHGHLFEAQAQFLGNHCGVSSGLPRQSHKSRAMF